MKFRVLTDQNETLAAQEELQVRIKLLEAESSSTHHRDGRFALRRYLHENVLKGIIVQEECERMSSIDELNEALKNLEGVEAGNVYYVLNQHNNTFGLIVSTSVGNYYVTLMPRVDGQGSNEHLFVQPGPGLENLVSSGSYNYFETRHVLDFGRHLDSVISKALDRLSAV